MKKLGGKFLSLYFIALFAIFGGVGASLASAATPSSILVDVVPPNPAPYEDTTITLNSYANSLDSVMITWSLDGKKVASGVGKKTFLLKAPAAGGETTVSALIALPEGSLEKKILIRASKMVLLWQANDSYVPPFYKGKALPTPESEIKVVAMPEIKGSMGVNDSKNMTYAWEKDYSNDQEASGYGKNFFLYTNDYLEDSSSVSVVASTVDQRYSSEANVIVGMSEPKIIFYKKDENLGTIWGKALPNPYRITGPEIIEAAPYFLSPKELQNPILVWTWSINNAAVATQGYNKNLMPLKAESGTGGAAKLRLQIENRYKVFQTAVKEITVEF